MSGVGGGPVAAAGEDVEAEVAAVLSLLVGLFGQDRADEADDGFAGGEDADRVGRAAGLICDDGGGGVAGGGLARTRVPASLSPDLLPSSAPTARPSSVNRGTAARRVGVRSRRLGRRRPAPGATRRLRWRRGSRRRVPGPR